jgi:hypothetical protein
MQEEVKAAIRWEWEALSEEERAELQQRALADIRSGKAAGSADDGAFDPLKGLWLRVLSGQVQGHHQLHG